MRFGQKWIKWIDGCLVSASVSVLVNGSLTEEFKLGKGIRQRDPLSPFLFIIAGEGLNLLMKEAVDIGLIRGAKVGKDKILLSHLQYAKDIYLHWGLPEIGSMANHFGCKGDNFPFSYLGLPVGANMNKSDDWGQ
ncbi:uncharacterized mitochondrial protein AtMg01250-like [Rutidosis leptorrhynchoides]|uniref:uncharacterized mitochondrial protein AtMg01250-like n=1 Tax=Rutidosis leptorrhynchoides TaxID=125765 RepID=UPI003A993D61